MDYEKLGLFYLGRRVNPETRAREDVPVLYDSSDLVTHAVIVGMTGSGKTGLGIDLIEEAAIDNLPVLAIDPKGDLANLLLTFPRLRGADLEPWINQDEARAAGQDAATFAANEAARWTRGLADWGQDGARIARLKNAAEFALYTPGSTTGLPLSIMASFAAPPPATIADAELLSDRVTTAATSVLGLAGVVAEPMRSREHVLVSTVFAEAWRQGRDLDLAALIAEVQAPPVAKVGVLDLEAFYPAADRFALATRLNHLLAAPGFKAWLEGDPLDIGRLLYTTEGKPRVSIISIAHLDDHQRMFFVSLLLNELVAWMRAERGTSSLRALVYFDELFGFLPPVANPPTKASLLTLLKQARAFGLGLTLATQNPVDLDYKALSNAGTWMLGRLQTEQDKARVLDGLEGVAASAGEGLNRARLDVLLSGLEKRRFLLHNVHEREPLVFETRWTLSYLRGPMGRDEIRRLADPLRTRPAAIAPVAPVARVAPAAPVAPDAPGAPAALGAPVAPVQAPILPPSIPQYFAPGEGGVWTPAILGVVRLTYGDAKLGVDQTRDITVFTPVTSQPVPVDWEHATLADFTTAELRQAPESPSRPFATLPSKATEARSYAPWSKDLARWAAESQALELRRSPRARLTSQPDEPERDFRLRVEMALRESRDAAIAKVREKHRPKLEAIEARIRRGEQAVQREAQQASESKLQASVSVAATVFGALLGRKAVTASTLGRATTAARGMSRAGRQAKDVDRAETDVARLREERDRLARDADEALQNVAGEWEGREATFETVLVKPKRGGVSVQLVALVWIPQ